FEDVVLDEGGVGRAVVGEIQAGDVGLDDVVDDVRAVYARRDDYAGAVEVGAGIVLHGKAFDGDVIGGDQERRGARSVGGRRAADDRLTGSARAVASIDAESRAADGQRLVDGH